MILAAEKGKPGEYYIISAGDLSTREMFNILSQDSGIPVPREAPKFLVRLAGNLLDPIGRYSNGNPLSVRSGFTTFMTVACGWMPPKLVRNWVGIPALSGTLYKR
jgi:hypothetical protein